MKSSNIHKIFPTLFYEFQWTWDELQPLLNEIQVKKKIIKQQSEAKPIETENPENYCTDYFSQVKLLEYEKLMEEVCTTFLPKLQCSIIEYWTAIYGKNAYHPAHAHSGPLFSMTDINMSSVLYLSDIGGTRFFNPSQIGVNHKDHYIQSEMGKMFMWPAQILHRVVPHGEKDEERYIIAANWQIQE